MLRTSSYTIYVPLPDEETTLLVHGYTGAYNRVSGPVARYVQSLDAEPPKPLYGEWSQEPAARRDSTTVSSPSDRTIEVLKRRGFLTAMTVDEEVGYFARTVKRLHAQHQSSPTSYIVMPTYDCNLRCPYCFQDHMRTNPAYSHLLRAIAPEMVDRIFTAFAHIESTGGVPAGNQPRRRIGFFGGEPLLAKNRPIIEYIITKANAAGPTTFWAVSNATELDAYADLLGGNGIQKIQITMDGPPKEHDRRRMYADGSGSFERIARNVDLCLDRGVTVSMRMNIDRGNVHLVPEFVDSVTAKGWHERSGFSLYTAPITNSSRDVSLVQLRSQYYTSWELDHALLQLRESHPSVSIISRSTDAMQRRAHSIFRKRNGGPAELKTSFCGAHATMYIFDAFGDVYACWERTGDQSIRIGTVLETGELELNDGMLRRWRSRTPASNPTCRHCRYALHCGGGCAVLAEARNGKLHSNHCDDFGDRFRVAVAKAYASYVSGKHVAEEPQVCDL